MTYENLLVEFVLVISLYFLPVWQYIDRWLTFNLDIDRNTSEIIKSRGFQSETHYVQTVDGYVLTVIRIVNPYVRKRLLLKPVLLQHGFMGNSDAWLLASMGQLTVGNSLGFVLAANGFDVWLANMRGNRYSLNHIRLSIFSKFWRFSIDEMIEYDLPAMIEYIKKQTKKDQIGYIGHSQGTYMMFALLATQPHYANTIKPFIALSPVPYLGNATSLLLNLGQYVYPLLRRFEFPFLLIERPLKFYAKLCDTTYWAQVVCYRIFYLILGFQSSQWNMTRTGVYISQVPSGSSSWNTAHLIQSFLANRPERYNHWDSRDNERRYNSSVPLAYDMEAINSTDIALIYAANDWLNHLDDVRLLKDHLKVKLLDDYLVPDSTWNHCELVMGTGAGQYVNVRVLDLLAKYLN
ncbi:lysosomal acid lipase/cholesteryl ester hydrolase-like [Oppia nitens]|uniref:lysosomal acid lipase/cholesteryl ester hydrolase-like n=1 Tax=Oppia nitens TaxID=1686743 RepID=UPI0023DA3C1D|nr:lysosomal acid lipase/cholesteryl ester hydrolase-like [Oppia nitens]